MSTPGDCGRKDTIANSTKDINEQKEIPAKPCNINDKDPGDRMQGTVRRTQNTFQRDFRRTMVKGGEESKKISRNGWRRGIRIQKGLNRER